MCFLAVARNKDLRNLCFGSKQLGMLAPNLCPMIAHICTHVLYFLLNGEKTYAQLHTLSLYTQAYADVAFVCICRITVQSCAYFCLSHSFARNELDPKRLVPMHGHVVFGASVNLGSQVQCLESS